MALARSATLLIGTRLACMLVGLAGVPILLSGLGTGGFAAWAVLLAAGFLFYNLETAMPPTVVKFLAAIRPEDDRAEADAVMTNAAAAMAAVFAVGLVLVALVAAPLARWLGLPDTPLFAAPGLLRFVCLAVAVCALVKLGVSGMHAAGRFDRVARIELLQVGGSSLAAWTVAWTAHRLDWTLVAYWGSQALLLFLAQRLPRPVFQWRFRRRALSGRRLLALLRHGVNLQLGEFAFFAHFQFDKFLVAGAAGLSEVAHYEVSSRAAVSLRNMPAAGFRALLPGTASGLAGGRDTWPDYLFATRWAACAAVFFLVGPLIVSPLFLFAWVGQIGYHGRWVFIWLALGMVFSVLAMPAAIFVQARGRTFIERRIALAALAANVLLTLGLVRCWGKEGAAAATGIVLAAANLYYLFRFHRLEGRRLRTTAASLWRGFWPVVPIGLLYAALVFWVTPLVIASRWYMAPAAVLIYVGFAASVAFAFHLTGQLGQWRPSIAGLFGPAGGDR